MRKDKEKTCKNPDCGMKFKPYYNSLQPVCSIACARILAKIKEGKKWRLEKAKRKAALMTHSGYIKKLVPIFNKYIRERDKHKGCISCKATFVKDDKAAIPEFKKFDAGHCFPAGHYANIRFDESNVHGQCVECNQHLHGNQAEYVLNLPDRIGENSFARLMKIRHEDMKHSIPELKALIIKYKEKSKKAKS